MMVVIRAAGAASAAGAGAAAAAAAGYGGAAAGAVGAGAGASGLEVCSRVLATSVQLLAIQPAKAPKYQQVQLEDRHQGAIQEEVAPASKCAAGPQRECQSSYSTVLYSQRTSNTMPLLKRCSPCCCCCSPCCCCCCCCREARSLPRPPGGVAMQGCPSPPTAEGQRCRSPAAPPPLLLLLLLLQLPTPRP